MINRNNNCRRCDCEIKKSVKSGGVWEKMLKSFSAIVLKYHFGMRWIVVCNKSSQNTLINIDVCDFGTNFLSYDVLYSIYALCPGRFLVSLYLLWIVDILLKNIPFFLCYFGLIHVGTVA